MTRKAISFLALLVLLSVRAFSQVGVTDISWESSSPLGKAWTPFAPITGLKFPAHLKMKDKLRVIFTVRNSSAIQAEGLVLRYALRLRLVKDGAPAETGVWGVPFRIEELRIAKAGAGAEKQVRAMRFELNEQIKKLAGTGFWFDALKLEVMVEPRKGGELPGIVQESVLTVTAVTGNQ
jgi:hypothetical protein